jgi:hypothetical protein
LLWGVTLGALAGWPGLALCAFAATLCRLTIDDSWAVLTTEGKTRVLRRRGVAAWTVVFELPACAGVALRRVRDTVVLRAGSAGATLRFRSSREASASERVLRVALPSEDASVEAPARARRLVQLDTRAPIAEWAWLFGALAATTLFAAVRGFPASLAVGLVLFVMISRVWRRRFAN